MTDAPKRPGRPKGSQNRNSALFRHAVDRHEFDVVGELIKAIAKIEDPDKQAEHLQKMLPYLYSRLKDVEEIKERLSNVDIQMTEDEINAALQ